MTDETETMEQYIQKNERRLIEALANLEHEQWMAWAQTLMDKEPGLSKERVARWKKYMVPYADLDDDVKEFDRVWARKVLSIIFAIDDEEALKIVK